ncbi:MAG: hypothetical protein AAF530_14450 [Pseudomonadota bacterium]
MKKRYRSSFKWLCSGIGLIAGLGIMAAAAHAKDNGEDHRKNLSGSFYNMPADLDCQGTAEEVVCSYKIQGFHLGDQGEVFRHAIEGSSQGNLEIPGDQEDSQSFVTWIFDDGSELVMISHGRAMVLENGQTKREGIQTCVDGSGRFAMMDCQFNWSNLSRHKGMAEGIYHGWIAPKLNG